MRKNILIVSILCLLCITTSYTYSAFKNTIKGNITATTNKWKFTVNVPSGVVEEDYYKVPINNSSGSFNIVLDNTGSLTPASYIINLEKIDLPDDFVINNSIYEGILSNESKTIKVTYSSSSSVNGYIKVKTEARKLEYAVMKNGAYILKDEDGGIIEEQYTEFWNNTYKPYIRTIKFDNDLSNLPSSCTESNLCWDITDSTSNNNVYSYLVDSGLKDSTDSTKTLYNLYIVSNLPIFAPIDCSYFFTDFSNLINIDFNNNFNTSNVTNMNDMFGRCEKLMELDLSGFNTSKVINMQGFLWMCSSLTNLNISNFNTSNVQNMRGIFNGCSSLTSLDISNFNTSNVTNMHELFYNCSSLTTLDLSSFNTSNVMDMWSMFNNCSSLTSLNISNFDTLRVTNMSAMFYGCSALSSLNISSFNTENVTNMSYMFHGCQSLTSLDLSNFNTSNVANIEAMFHSCSSLTSLDLSNFDTSNVTNMSSTFYKCSALTNLNISNFNTSNVTNMVWMFELCSSLTTLDLNNFDISKVTDTRWMFSGCSKLSTTININSTSITKYDGMFF